MGSGYCGMLYLGEYFPTYGPIVPPSYTGEALGIVELHALLTGTATLVGHITGTAVVEES